MATFNASLNRDTAGGLVADVSRRDNAQAANVAEVIQRVRPEVLLVNEFDYDPAGRALALFQENYLVIAGDLNADPYDGDSVPGAAQQLLDHPRVDDRVVPASAGGTAAAQRQGGANLDHRGDPRFDTGDFADTSPGNLRVDYLLPSRGLPVRSAGVFWPVPGDPLFRLVGDYSPALPGGFPTSDHRLVWLDLRR